MDFIVNWLYATSDFLDSGGPVLKLLSLVMFLYWLLIFERFFFLGSTHRRLAGQALEKWSLRTDRESWNSSQIRDAMLSRLNLSAQSTIPVIKTFVALCPLLGLLGTVTGMIAIFDVMSLKGTGNARSMADGVSRATIPTMAGMVAALAGVFGVTLVSKRFEGEMHALANCFRTGAGARGTAPRRPGPFGRPASALISLALAVAVTAALLGLMQVLIETGKGALTESESAYFVDFVRIPQEETIERKERKLERPRSAEAPPEFDPQQNQALDNLSGDNVIAVGAPEMDTSVIQGGGDFSLFSSADGEYLPIVKVQAIYPRTALARGIEGYVILEFTVTTTGGVRDPVVLESSHKIFEKAAIEAALKFKYKPRIVDGQPIEVAGVVNQITFEIQDN